MSLSRPQTAPSVRMGKNILGVAVNMENDLNFEAHFQDQGAAFAALVSRETLEMPCNYLPRRPKCPRYAHW